MKNHIENAHIYKRDVFFFIFCKKSEVFSETLLFNNLVGFQQFMSTEIEYHRSFPKNKKEYIFSIDLALNIFFFFSTQSMIIPAQSRNLSKMSKIYMLNTLKKKTKTCLFCITTTLFDIYEHTLWFKLGSI